MRRLRDGELDLGIVPYAENYEGIELEPLFPGESLVVALPPDHRLAAKDVLGPDDLRGEVLVMFPRAANPALYDRLLGLYERVGYCFRGLRETDGTDARDLLLAVAAGYGVALVTFPILESTGAAPAVIWRSLQSPLPMPDAMLAWRATPPRGLQPLLEGGRDRRRLSRRRCSRSAPPVVAGSGRASSIRTRWKRGYFVGDSLVSDVEMKPRDRGGPALLAPARR